MKKLSYQLVLVAIFISVIAASCTSGKSMGGTSKKCGCGLHKGYVGY